MEPDRTTMMMLHDALIQCLQQLRERVAERLESLEALALQQAEFDQPRQRALAWHKPSS